MTTKKERITFEDGTTIEYTPFDFGEEQKPTKLKWIFPKNNSNVLKKALKSSKKR